MPIGSFALRLAVGVFRAAVAVVALSTVVPSVVAQHIYWADIQTHKTSRADLDGSNVVDLKTGLGDPLGISLDVGSSELYWADDAGNRIRKTLMDGTGPIVEVLAGVPQPRDLALDVGDSKMYWTDSNSNAIHRANMSGAGSETLFSLGAEPHDPQGIALHLGDRQVYWIDNISGDSKIQKGSMDGSGLVITILSSLNSARDIALDAAAGKMYWSDGSNNAIYKADLDGMNMETVVTGLFGPFGIALDVADGHVYWADVGSATIRRANMDGSGDEMELVSGLVETSSLALDLSASVALLRNDEVTSLTPVTPSLDTILPLDPSPPPAGDRYIGGFASGDVDPAPSAGLFVVYGLDSPMGTLKLTKSGSSIRIVF